MSKQVTRDILQEKLSEFIQSQVLPHGHIDIKQQEQLLNYLDLLLKWNQVFNLTAVRGQADMLTRHLFDSLTVLQFLPRQGRVIDVGSGGGLPGIPLAICRPDLSFHLLDCNSKKTRFMFQAKIALSLDHVVVHHKRVETISDQDGFSLVTSRAFKALPEFFSLTSNLISETGCWLAMKGADWQSEAQLKQELEGPDSRQQFVQIQFEPTKAAQLEQITWFDTDGNQLVTTQELLEVPTQGVSCIQRWLPISLPL